MGIALFEELDLLVILKVRNEIEPLIVNPLDLAKAVSAALLDPNEVVSVLFTLPYAVEVHCVLFFGVREQVPNDANVLPGDLNSIIRQQNRAFFAIESLAGLVDLLYVSFDELPDLEIAVTLDYLVRQ